MNNFISEVGVFNSKSFGKTALHEELLKTYMLLQNLIQDPLGRGEATIFGSTLHTSFVRVYFKKLLG
jgi:hypothetical protein